MENLFDTKLENLLQFLYNCTPNSSEYYEDKIADLCLIYTQEIYILGVLNTYKDTISQIEKNILFEFIENNKIIYNDPYLKIKNTENAIKALNNIKDTLEMIYPLMCKNITKNLSDDKIKKPINKKMLNSIDNLQQALKESLRPIINFSIQIKTFLDIYTSTGYNYYFDLLQDSIKKSYLFIQNTGIQIALINTMTENIE